MRNRNKAEVLYVFVTSPRPDPYVNTLVHVTRSNDLKEIYFIGIEEHVYSTESVERQAASISAATTKMLENLAAGSYGLKDGVERLDNDSTLEYKRCLDRIRFVQISARGVRWDDLADDLHKFSRVGLPIFDVTALKKNLLVDVVSILLSYGERNIRVFEIEKSPTYGAEDLIHALREGIDYNYRRLTKSKHVEQARRRMISRTTTFYALVATTVAIFLPVTLIQVYLPTSWVQTAVVAVGTTVSIASWAFSLARRL